MKKFEEAKLEVMTFESDVIATSGDDTCPTKGIIECADTCGTKCPLDGLCPTNVPCYVKLK